MTVMDEVLDPLITNVVFGVRCPVYRQRLPHSNWQKNNLDL